MKETITSLRKETLGRISSKFSDQYKLETLAKYDRIEEKLSYIDKLFNSYATFKQYKTLTETGAGGLREIPKETPIEVGSIVLINHKSNNYFKIDYTNSLWEMVEPLPQSSQKNTYFLRYDRDYCVIIDIIEQDQSIKKYSYIILDLNEKNRLYSKLSPGTSINKVTEEDLKRYHNFSVGTSSITNEEFIIPTYIHRQGINMFASVPVLSKVPKSSEFTDVPLPRPEFNIIEEKNKAFDFVSETMATQEEQQIRHYMLYPEKYNMVWSVGNKTAIRLDNLVCDHYKKSIDEAYDTFIEGLINTPIGYYFSLKKDLLTSMNYHSTIASLKISKTQLSKFLTIVNQLPVYYQFKNKMIPGKVSIIEPLLGTNDNVDHEQHVKQLLSNHLSSDSDFKVVVNTNDSKIFSAEIEFDKNIYYVNTLKGGSFNNYSLIIEKIGDIDQNKYLYYQFIGNIGPTFKRTSGPGPDIISVTIKDQTYHVKLEDYGVFKGWSIGNVVYSNFSDIFFIFLIIR